MLRECLRCPPITREFCAIANVCANSNADHEDGFGPPRQIAAKLRKFGSLKTVPLTTTRDKPEEIHGKTG